MGLQHQFAAQSVFIVHQQGGYVALTKFDRCGKSRRPPADDQNIDIQDRDIADRDAGIFGRQLGQPFDTFQRQPFAQRCHA